MGNICKKWGKRLLIDQWKQSCCWQVALTLSLYLILVTGAVGTVKDWLVIAMQEPGIYKPKDESFAQFIWNSERGEFLGRTGTSWRKYFLFYLNIYIFYVCCKTIFNIVVLQSCFATFFFANRWSADRRDHL